MLLVTLLHALGHIQTGQWWETASSLWQHANLSNAKATFIQNTRMQRILKTT